jgi:hypothetical protein
MVFWMFGVECAIPRHGGGGGGLFGLKEGSIRIILILFGM